MSPEIIFNEAYDYTVDLYSLGCMFYYLCTGNSMPNITD